ncbi:MAG: response regulator transcription factor [Bacteroidia bacterium]|nr:response regulator transcription factor [Bacteroidia bacterium]
MVLNLELENYRVSAAGKGKDALEQFKTKYKDLNLVLLDVMLPDINGYDLCKEFKQIDAAIPVIFLTAKNQTADKINGLKLGADDYITKPFDLEELLLRISNTLKRNRKEIPGSFYSFRGGSINFDTFEITSTQGQNFLLSKREIGLLELLTKNVNKVISRDEIIEKLWDVNENASSRTIDNYILNFRKHFEKNPKAPEHFLSIRGVGYKFVD